MTKRQSYSKRSDLPANEIVTRYQAGESLKQIAAAYGTSDNTVRRLLEDQGVQRRPGRVTAKRTDPESEARDGEIVELYGEGVSTVTLSKRYGLATSAVRSILLRNGVTLRSRSEAAHSSQPSLPQIPDSALPSERITAEYESGASVASLAKTYGVSDVTILGLLRRHGVELRTKQSLPAEEVIAQYREGASLADLAQTHGVSVTTIRRVMGASGEERRSPRPARVVSPEMAAEITRRNGDGESLRSIAASLGISRTAVKGALDRQAAEPSGPRRHARPDLPTDEIVKRRAAGESAHELAAEYGVTVSTINRRLQKATSDPAREGRKP